MFEEVYGYLCDSIKLFNPQPAVNVDLDRWLRVLCRNWRKEILLRLVHNATISIRNDLQKRIKMFVVGCL